MSQSMSSSGDVTHNGYSMYSMENYFWGVVGYLVGAIVVLWYLVRLLGHIPFKYVRHILVIVFMAILFAPIMAYTDQPFFAPAFVVMVFEGFFETGGADWTRAIPPIVFVFSVLFLAFCVSDGGVSSDPADAAEAFLSPPPFLW